MPTSRQKREQHATRNDAARGQQVVNRLVRVVEREQRLANPRTGHGRGHGEGEGSGPSYANFNSQPQAGWKKEWKAAHVPRAPHPRLAVDSLGPDLAWTDDQSWLQGSKKCFELSKGAVAAAKAAGYAGVLF